MIKILLKLLFFTAILTSCADSQNVSECVKDTPYNFWGGLWHGAIAPISFILSLFNDEIAVYAMNNNGAWYTFGFLLGVGSLGVGSSSRSKR